MPFFPHTEAEVREMLNAVGANSINDLFDEIPQNLGWGGLATFPAARSELEVSQLMSARARLDGAPSCFIGAGAYDHHIPAAVWQIATRDEFYSACTPHHAEANQGTLQLIYEFQSMMAALTAMDLCNGSLHDGASALVAAILMAVRVNHKSVSRRILVPKSLHPAYRRVADNILHHQGIVLEQLPYDAKGGHTDPAVLQGYIGQDITALVIPQPNFFGVLEEADALAGWAQANNVLTIAVVNPLALSVLSPPGSWGGQGADICCGEGQPLGVPLSSGGPYFGFLGCRWALLRQMPGWIAGRTRDRTGQTAYSLIPQASDQSPGTASIFGSQQASAVTAATVHMALMGAEGLAQTAAKCHANTRRLAEKLCSIPGVALKFDRPVFHEQVLALPLRAQGVLRTLAAHNILGGLDLSRDYPELGNAILVCATERRTCEEIDSFAGKLERAIRLQAGAPCQLQPNNW